MQIIRAHLAHSTVFIRAGLSDSSIAKCDASQLGRLPGTGLSCINVRGVADYHSVIDQLICSSYFSLTMTISNPSLSCIRTYA